MVLINSVISVLLLHYIPTIAILGHLRGLHVGYTSAGRIRLQVP